MIEQGGKENAWKRVIRYHEEHPEVAIRVQVTEYLPDPQSAFFIYPTKHSLDLMVMILCAPHFAGMILTLLPFAQPFDPNERMPHNPEYENIVGAYARYNK